MNNVCIIGAGVVGKAHAIVLQERGLEVFIYDKFINEYNKIPLPKLILKLEENPSFRKVYLICLPTPMKANGSANISAIEEVLEILAGDRLVIIKSTVPPGSTEIWNKKYSSSGLRILFSPEFLTSKSSVEDLRNQNRLIMGGPISWIESLGPNPFGCQTLITLNSTEAELLKYITNCFLATKLSFANEMYELASVLKVDYDKISQALALDERLGSTHWKVPSFDIDEEGNPLKGFGGDCLPKDLAALIYTAKELGIDPMVLEAIQKKNLKIRGK